MNSLKNRCAIVAMGRSMTHKGDPVLKTTLQLEVEAATMALKKAGIQRHQVGALFTGRMPRSCCSLQFNQAVLNELKIAPKYCTEVTAHGAGALGTLMLATMALNAGVIDYALCTTGEASTVWTDVVHVTANWEADLQFEAPYGPTTPSIYAVLARRYMHEYGITSAQMAKVAVENRKWALRHPYAAMRDRGEITVEDVLNSRMISSPLHLLDCAVWFPGGIGSAAVVTRAEIARETCPDPSYIVGFGQASTHEWVGERMGTWGVEPVMDGPSLVRTGAFVAAKDAYAMAGVGPKDLDLAECSSPFTFGNLLMLEEFGLCDVGEGGRFVESGGVDFDGGFPFNTTGGYLSFGQSGQGLFLLKEVMDQVHGRAEGRQVPNAKLGLVHGHGGPFACHSVMLVSNEPIS